MKDLISNSIYFGFLISIIGYEIGLLLKKKFKKAFFNPLLVSIIFIISFLLIFQIDYESYYNGAKYLSYLLTPATVCLSIPLYQQLTLLKNNYKAILGGIFSGVLTSLTSILILSKMFALTQEQYITLLPKSITTAIGIGVSEELGGIVTLTVATIILTGILGNILAETICKIFRIQEPVAKGVAIGTSSHAIGTAKAMEIGEIEGAMSSLAIAVAGLITVVAASIYANFI
ncbi:LrgB family protein [Mobilitalea sibirica]|uniref:LrgB family protein n=1 Tax=Mobilitalea sibirica TaxID=1462919 RepID=A0A8J7H225_9FIRM|nr:LrgB family protein [Mobilitalea sibirica]MBH1940425.1 LrgB family protein [Mobilitalea sibirica]